MNRLIASITRSPSMWPAAATIGLSILLRRDVATVRRNGMWVSCGTSGGQGAYCAVAGLDYEPELRWLVDQLSPGDVFVDVGANIGIYSLHCGRKVGPRGHVFAVEPCSPAVAMLENNVRSNKLSETVTVVHAAAADKTGRLYLSGDPTKWNSLQLSTEPPGSEILVTTIDEILSSRNLTNKSVKCIKIDAEGVEVDVLEGAENTLKIQKPIIIFENAFENTRARATEWLKDHHYSVGFVDVTGKFTPDPLIAPTSCTNLVALYTKEDR